jgi:23S rRNA (guanine745-N1)-methyltransferase
VTPSTARIHALCSVRGCERELARRPGVWICPDGHCFDVARSGYVNLLQPGDRRSRSPGDAPDVVAARARLEERGLGTEWRSAVESKVGGLVRDGATALDVGAGTGLLVARLASIHRLEGWALDISVPAVRLGSRRWPEVSWVVVNAHRNLPFGDRVFTLVLSSTGPKNPREFRRILAPDGALLLVVPGPDDLIELREALLGEGRRTDRAERALEHFGPFFHCADRSVVRTRRRLDRAELADLLAATYRGARRAEAERIAALDGLETTLCAELLHLVPRRP